MTSWWEQAVVYQIYPRSFQDSDGDGVGDLEGIRARLDYLRRARRRRALAVADLPVAGRRLGLRRHRLHRRSTRDFGTLDDFDALRAGGPRARAARALDLVPSHTSIEHPWFREHPDWYVWAGRGRRTTGSRPSAAPAWSRDEDAGAGTCTRSTRSRPTSTGATRGVGAAIGDTMPLLARRAASTASASTRSTRIVKDPPLRDDPPATEPPVLPLPDELRARSSTSTRGTTRRSASGSRCCARPPATRCSSARCSCRRRELAPLSRHIDLAFAFELMFARVGARRDRAASTRRGLGAVSRGCSRTTTSRGWPRGWARRTCGSRPRCS